MKYLMVLFLLTGCRSDIIDKNIITKCEFVCKNNEGLSKLTKYICYCNNNAEFFIEDIK